MHLGRFTFILMDYNKGSNKPLNYNYNYNHNNYNHNHTNNFHYNHNHNHNYNYKDNQSQSQYQSHNPQNIKKVKKSKEKFIAVPPGFESMKSNGSGSGGAPEATQYPNVPSIPVVMAVPFGGYLPLYPPMPFPSGNTSMGMNFDYWWPQTENPTTATAGVFSLQDLEKELLQDAKTSVDNTPTPSPTPLTHDMSLKKPIPSPQHEIPMPKSPELPAKRSPRVGNAGVHGSAEKDLGGGCEEVPLKGSMQEGMVMTSIEEGNTKHAVEALHKGMGDVNGSDWEDEYLKNGNGDIEGMRKKPETAAPLKKSRNGNSKGGSNSNSNCVSSNLHVTANMNQNYKNWNPRANLGPSKSLNTTPEKYKNANPAPQTERKRVNKANNTQNFPVQTLSPEISSAISIEIENLYQTLQPTQQEIQQRNNLVRRLEELVQSIFPDHSPSIHVYGSSGNGLLCTKADLDICLNIDISAGSPLEILSKLSDNLLKNNMKNVKPLMLARCPIIKFQDPETDISCDVCLNNELAIRNTKLLADYMSLDDRVKKLAVCIKYWAKRRKINETYEGFLSSYSYVIMLINFLQRRKPPILPSLQQHKKPPHPNPSNLVEGFDCYCYPHLSDLQSTSKANSENLGELLFGFFKLYAFHFKYKEHVISIRTIKYLDKADKEKEWEVRCGNKRTHNYFTLEDPFEITHNLARNTDIDQLKVLKYEFSRASWCIANGEKLSKVSALFKYINQ
uniref:Uncharacterized protein n=1 Tax=Arcella intermedia TaxID=1963864 RepID=A0A6B2KYF2_9EUKA